MQFLFDFFFGQIYVGDREQARETDRHKDDRYKSRKGK